MLRIVIFFISGIAFSVASIAEVEETTTYGTPYTYGNPNYHGNVPPGWSPGGGMSGGPSPSALAQKKAAEKAGCEAQVTARFSNQCYAEADSIYSDAKNTCNSIVQGGGFITTLSTIALGYIGKPTSVRMRVAFVAASAGAVAGGAVVNYGATTCRDNADNDYEFNKNQCKDYINNLKATYCPQ